MLERLLRQKMSQQNVVPVAVLAVILMTVGTVGFIEYSAQPGFCKSCHNMVPYYDSWASSSSPSTSA